jgi:poly-beta-hydroxyalkanoate depolymerase
MPKKNLSTFKAEQLVIDMMSRITLRNSMCDLIVLSRHAPNNKSDDPKTICMGNSGRYSMISLNTV